MKKASYIKTIIHTIIDTIRRKFSASDVGSVPKRKTLSNHRVNPEKPSRNSIGVIVRITP